MLFALIIHWNWDDFSWPRSSPRRRKLRPKSRIHKLPVIRIRFGDLLQLRLSLIRDLLGGSGVIVDLSSGRNLRRRHLPPPPAGNQRYGPTRGAGAGLPSPAAQVAISTISNPFHTTFSSSRNLI